MRKMFGVIALGVLAFSTFATPAAAQTGPDYVFNVPVRIENAPPLAGRPATVHCSVAAYDMAAGRPSGTYHANTTVTIGATGFRDTVRLEITLPPGVARADVRHWSCGLSFLEARNPSGEIVPVPGGVDRAVSYRNVTGQAVASSQFLTQGSFVR